MGGQSWLVGASSECDVVIDAATVSGRHCRLTYTSDGFLLEDLESTNGTYVNGQRIVRPRRVTPSDDITLGRTIRLPWASVLSVAEPQGSAETPVDGGTEGVEHRPHGNSSIRGGTSARRSGAVRIGRSGDNEVVLDHEGVSDHHAQLIVREGVLTLEDLGSESGTAIGSPERRISRASVGLDETVFFGPVPIHVSRLVQAVASKAEEGTVSGATGSDPTERVHAWRAGKWWAVAASGLLLLAGILGGGVLFLGDDHAASAPGDDVPAGPARGERAGGKDDALRTSPAPSRAQGRERGDAKHATAPAPSKSGSAEAATEGHWSEALLLVLVGNENGEFYRVGTGWAVAPKTVVSTGSVVMTTRELSKRFPKTMLFSPAQNQTIPVVSLRVHPRYEEAAAACDQAEKELETLRQQLEELARSQEEPSASELDPTRMREKWVDARLEAMKAAERQVYFDAAAIRLAEPIKACLTLAPSERRTSLRPRMKVRTPGLAFDFKDPFFDPATRPTPATLNGRIEQRVRYEDATPGIERLTIQIEEPLSNESEREQLKYNYVGSPVLNEREQVVAMYSRPTPSDQIGEPPSGRSFDATLVNRIEEVVQLVNGGTP